MFSSALVSQLVCLLAGLRKKNYETAIFRKSDGNVAREPRKKPLDFGGNPVDVGVSYG